MSSFAFLIGCWVLIKALKGIGALGVDQKPEWGQHHPSDVQG